MREGWLPVLSLLKYDISCGSLVSSSVMLKVLISNLGNSLEKGTDLDLHFLKIFFCLLQVGSDVVECRYCLEPINWVEKKRVTEHMRSQKHLKAKMAAVQGQSASPSASASVSASASAGPLDHSATSATSAKILNDNATDSIQHVLQPPEDLSDNDDECDNVNDISDREAEGGMLGPLANKRRRLRAAEAATATPVVTLASRLKGQLDRHFFHQNSCSLTFLLIS